MNWRSAMRASYAWGIVWGVKAIVSPEVVWVIGAVLLIAVGSYGWKDE